MLSIQCGHRTLRQVDLAYEPLGKQKAPKVLADALTWMDTAVLEFGLAGLSLRNLIEFLKTALKNSNAAVRTSATKTLVTVRLFAGTGTPSLSCPPRHQTSHWIIHRNQGFFGGYQPTTSRDDPGRI